MKLLKINLVVVFLLLSIFSFTIQNSTYQLGDKIDDLEFVDSDNKAVHLKELSAQNGFVLVFTSNNCPYAKMYEGRIKALYEAYKDKGIEVLAVNPNDVTKSPADSFEKMKSKNFPFKYVKDQSKKVALSLGAKRTPEVFLIQKHNSELHLVYKGAIDDSANASKVNVKYLEDAIEKMLGRKQITNKETTVTGCTIK